MSKEELIRKLTSRKFWMAVALFVSGLLTATGHKDQSTVAYGLIMQGAAVVAYIVGEGLTDASRTYGTEEYLEESTDDVEIM